MKQSAGEKTGVLRIDREKIGRLLMARSGLCAWLLKWVRARAEGREHHRSRLALLERITLAPRQSLALVEAEGKRFLVATSPEGGPAFYALDGEAAARGRSCPRAALRVTSRASW